MASDIITCLELDKDIESTQIIVVQEIRGCDSSFLTSCVLGHCIKNKKAVIIISTHNSLTHYKNVGLKMNYNLQNSIDLGLICFYSLGDLFVENQFKNCVITLEEITNDVIMKIKSMYEKYGMVNVILDGVSHLFDMQYSVKDVNNMCRSLIKLLKCYNNSFLICHCNVASEHDATYICSNLLCHMAHVVLEVQSLASGWSVDVSGHLTIKYPGRKFEYEHMNTLDIKPSHYLFKLFDRGIKLLAPGTV